MSDLIFFSIIFAMLFTSGAAIGYKIDKGYHRKLPPTRMQLALSTAVSREIRASRMHGQMDGWALAHRTDSEPLSTNHNQ